MPSRTIHCTGIVCTSFALLAILSITWASHPSQAQLPEPLQAPAIVRTTADQPVTRQLFNGPTGTKKKTGACV